MLHLKAKVLGGSDPAKTAATKEEESKRKQEAQRWKQEEQRRKEEHRKNEEAIIQGLALGRVIWHDSFCPDFWFYMKNNHTILAIFCCHKMHPYTRWKRAVVWLCGTFGNFGFSCIWYNYSACQCDAGQSCSCEMEGGDLVQVASRASALCMSIMLFLMYWFYTCRMARKGGPLYCGAASEKCIVGLTKPIICYVSLVCFIIFGIGYMVQGQHQGGYAIICKIWAMSEFYQFFIGFVFQGCFFLSLYMGCPCCNGLCTLCWGSGQGGGERPSFCYPHKTPDGQYYPIGDEGLTMLWGGDRCSSTYGDIICSSSRSASGSVAQVAPQPRVIPSSTQALQGILVVARTDDTNPSSDSVAQTV
jgi:hypothetical protein